jgi:murein DD-endopeptidase MepM/ murein hydrolase activator NlpD
MGPRGLFVTIQHPHELTSSYMHLASYKVRQWQNVQSGDLIGYVGRSGMKTSSAHLHFEIAYRGKPIDPMPYLNAYLFPPEATHWGFRKNTKLKSDHKRQDSAIFLDPM